jgi:mono/diheme cytochrome c family protein
MFLRSFLAVCVGSLPVVSAMAVESAFTPDERGFARTQPFFDQYCLKCHEPDSKESSFRLGEKLPNDFSDRAVREKWGEVLNVLGGHEMPPEGEPQPTPDEAAAIIDWITAQLVAAERAGQSQTIVMRRLNRNEYKYTIKDLLNVDFDVAMFPLDSAAGGFDNNGKALSFSPLQMELHVAAAQQILDRAIVTAPRPDAIKWRFEVDNGAADDSTRVRIDDKNNPIVNAGNNPLVNGFKKIHHPSWDKGIGVRDFRVPEAGNYIVRMRTYGRTPGRTEVVESAKAILQGRFDQQNKENPNGERWHREAFDNDLKHFEVDPNYSYGPPRLKLVVQLGPQPTTIAEFDVSAKEDTPDVLEFQTYFTTESAGVFLEYAYDVPSVAENFWMIGNDAFARPEVYVDWMEVEGPVFETASTATSAATGNVKKPKPAKVAAKTNWPPVSHLAILPEPFPKVKATTQLVKAERGYAQKTLERFMPKAYRRPVTKDEVATKLKLYETARDQGSDFVEAMKLSLVAALASPHFLYMAEQSLGGAETARGSAEGRLSPYEYASRLSYFLWSSLPDEELMELAKENRLADDKVVKQQIKRMLASPKADRFVKGFVDQWLGLREVGSNPPAKDLYARYDRHLELSIVAESREFFRTILNDNLNVMNFVSSDFVVINERMARHYGIPDVHGDAFRKVKVPEGVERGGIVTQASILSITSNGTRTSPVKRGTWVMKNLLGQDPGLPVANAGDIAPKVPGLDKATVRQRLEIHRTLAQCARCHNKIDPLGFALENFNAAGEYRTHEGFGYRGRVEPGDPAIDASSKLPDGTPITGVTGLRQALLTKEDLFLKCLAEKLLTYSLGRELTVGDTPTVQAAVKHVKANDYTLKSLIEFCATSDSFRNR